MLQESCIFAINQRAGTTLARRPALTKPTVEESNMAKTGLCSVPGCIKRGILRKTFCEPHYDRFMKYGTPYGGGTFRGVPLAWLKNRKKWSGNECLIWPFAERGQGYGGVSFEGRNERAHRVMCILAHGPAPSPEHEAAHSCGKGHQGCVNPRHLSWKTRSGNQQDRVGHGTHNRGERSAMQVLTEPQVVEIRSLHHRESQVSLAARFGVSRSTIRAIHDRRSWAWLQ
ncbi:hypothetical protein EIK56_18115 [Sphingomonas sp. C8-2]|jgi:hypothetical protein|nr:hypothetical protein EIK56_18115 [Sphingomonas sp. C8-2]